MLSIFSNLTRVYSRMNLKTPITKFRCIHGISKILVDGRIVLLNNSKNGSVIYLLGTFHNSIGCANNVKKVINHVKPDAIALELCLRRARRLLQEPPKFDFQVAMKECSRIGADCFFIDQEEDDMVRGAHNLLTSDEAIYDSYVECRHESQELLERRSLTRAWAQEYGRLFKEGCPEYYKLKVEDRDELMFLRLRQMEGKRIVAVVGMGHLDGIESLWKRAEGDADVQPLEATSDEADLQKQ